MARKQDSSGCAIIIIAVILMGVIAATFKKIASNPGLMIVLTMLSIVGFYIYIRFNQMKKEEQKAAMIKAREERIVYLMSKYHDQLSVDRIMAKELWQGMTADQVKDSIGTPAAIDQELLKTKRRDTWKYYPQGANRYNLKLVVENDVLVGWDKKG